MQVSINTQKSMQFYVIIYVTKHLRGIWGIIRAPEVGMIETLSNPTLIAYLKLALRQRKEQVV